MIKCTICENHQRTGAKHTCSKCEKKIIYGVMQEPFIECCEYKEFLKHLGIKPMLMEANMRSRLPDSKKPMFISRCKEFEVCVSAKNGGCRGCNVWNYLYDIKALQKWCKEHNKDFMLYTMEMHRHLKEQEK